MVASKTDRVLELAEEQGFLRAADLEEEESLPRCYLPRLETRGALKRVARDIYARLGRDITEHHDLALAAKRVGEGGVICLLSALRFHELTTQAPFEVWIALEEGGWVPKKDAVPLRTVHMSPESHADGIEEHRVWKTKARVYSSAKTVADCFKFRGQVGTDVAIEALRAYRQRRAGSMDDLWHSLAFCRDLPRAKRHAAVHGSGRLTKKAIRASSDDSHDGRAPLLWLMLFI